MKKLFEVADRYIGQSDWKTIAVLKFCLISLGLMVGISLRPEHKKPVFFGALGVFLASYTPLMVKFYRVFTQKENGDV